MQCNEIRIYLAIRPDLTTREENEVQSHLAHCPGCRDAWKYEERTTQILRQLQPLSSKLQQPRVFAR